MMGHNFDSKVQNMMIHLALCKSACQLKYVFVASNVQCDRCILFVTDGEFPFRSLGFYFQNGASHMITQPEDFLETQRFYSYFVEHYVHLVQEAKVTRNVEAQCCFQSRFLAYQVQWNLGVSLNVAYSKCSLNALFFCEANTFVKQPCQKVDFPSAFSCKGEKLPAGSTVDKLSTLFFSQKKSTFLHLGSFSHEGGITFKCLFKSCLLLCSA